MGLARTLEVPLGLKLEQASLRWSGWETLSNFAGSDAAPEGGYEALLAKVFKGVDVKLSTTVKSIEYANNVVTVTDTNGKTYTARSVICTIPLGVLKTLPSSTFSPALPERMQEAIKGTHVGVLEKIIMHYSEAWWPNAEKTGSYTFLPTSTKPLTENSTPREILDVSTLIVANFAGPSLPHPSPTLLTYLSETPALGLLKHDIESVSSAYHQFLVDRLGVSSNPHGTSGSRDDRLVYRSFVPRSDDYTECDLRTWGEKSDGFQRAQSASLGWQTRVRG